MIDRFRNYVLFDHRARVRNDGIAAAVAFLYSCVRFLGAKPSASNHNILYETAIVLFLGMCVGTFWYCAHPQFISKANKL